jgi:hypothetical protein
MELIETELIVKAANETVEQKAVATELSKEDKDIKELLNETRNNTDKKD